MKDPQQEETTQIYNLGAEEYKQASEDFSFPGNMFEYFIEKIAGKTILDVGCAFGRDMLKMKKLGFDVRGIEISQPLIKLAAPSIKNQIIHDDMNNIDTHFPNKSLDAIFSSASIVHMDKDVATSFLEKSYNILHKNGTLFLSIKVGETTQTISQQSYSINTIKKYTIYSPQDISQILNKIGFKIIKTHTKHLENNSWMILICKK